MGTLRQNLVKIPDCSSLWKAHNETTVFADNHGDLVGSEAPFTVHLSFLFFKLCALAQGTSQFSISWQRISPNIKIFQNLVHKKLCLIHVSPHMFDMKKIMHVLLSFIGSNFAILQRRCQQRPTYKNPNETMDKYVLSKEDVGYEPYWEGCYAIYPFSFRIFFRSQAEKKDNAALINIKDTSWQKLYGPPCKMPH